MALIVQDDTGTVAGAAAYVAVSYFKAYHDARGNPYSPYTDQQIEQAIIKATDYLDGRFSYRGVRANQTDVQSTMWPRWDAVDDDNNWVRGVPEAVKRACSEYALRALSSALNPDPVSPDDSGMRVRRVSKTAGPVSKDVEYQAFGPGFVMPLYPAADRLLVAAGLTLATNRTARA